MYYRTCNKIVHIHLVSKYVQNDLLGALCVCEQEVSNTEHILIGTVSTSWYNFCSYTDIWLNIKLCMLMANIVSPLQCLTSLVRSCMKLMNGIKIDLHFSLFWAKFSIDYNLVFSQSLPVIVLATSHLWSNLSPKCNTILMNRTECFDNYLLQLNTSFLAP